MKTVRLSAAGILFVLSVAALTIAFVSPRSVSTIRQDDADWAASAWTDSCAKCHGVDGKADGPLLTSRPELKEKIPVFNKAFFDKEKDDHLVANVRVGLPRKAEQKLMPAFGGEYTDEEIGRMITWMRASWGQRSE